METVSVWLDQFFLTYRAAANASELDQRHVVGKEMDGHMRVAVE
jgi:hypothetical protein